MEENFSVRLMDEIAAYDAETIIDLFLEAKLRKVDVVSELPTDLKQAIERLQKWIDGYGTGGGDSPFTFNSINIA